MGFSRNIEEGMTSLTNASREGAGGERWESILSVSLGEGPTWRRTKVSRGSNNECVLANVLRDVVLELFDTRKHFIQAVEELRPTH